MLDNRKRFIEEMKEESRITKFFEDLVVEFDENGKPNRNPSTYSLSNDSIFMRGTFRQDKNSGKIKIIKDTLYLEKNSYKEFEIFLLDLKWDYKMDVPKDIKLEKIVRYVTFVRVHDCDQYQE